VSRPSLVGWPAGRNNRADDRVANRSAGMVDRGRSGQATRAARRRGEGPFPPPVFSERARTMTITGNDGNQGISRSSAIWRFTVVTTPIVPTDLERSRELAGFRQRQMREQAIGRSAVPVHRVRRDIDRIARVQHLRLLALEADAGARHQRCWVHKTVNVLNKVALSVQINMKADLREIYGAPTRAAADAAIDVFADKYSGSHPTLRWRKADSNSQSRVAGRYRHVMPWIVDRRHYVPSAAATACPAPPRTALSFAQVLERNLLWQRRSAVTRA
jgi:hypothetical protein